MAEEEEVRAVGERGGWDRVGGGYIPVRDEVAQSTGQTATRGGGA